MDESDAGRAKETDEDGDGAAVGDEETDDVLPDERLDEGDEDGLGMVDVPDDGSDPSIDGDTVARLVGPDIAEALGVRDRRFTPAEVDALTDALAEGTDLAEDALGGDPDVLFDLFDPPFMQRYTGFDDFEAFLSASPWFEADLPDVFAGRADGETESPAAHSSSFVERTTAFGSPGEMVTNAILDRCRRRVEAAE